MTRGLFVLLLAALAAFAAGDDWAKVKALKTGADIRVYKMGSAKPILGQMDELTDDNLVILVKKTETAIPRDQIDRIDARPSNLRTPSQTTTKESTPPGDPAAQPTTTTSTNVSLGKLDFETIYRRPTGAPKK